MLLLVMAERSPITLLRETRLRVSDIITWVTIGYTSTAYFWSAQGYPLRFCGTTAIDGFDDVIVQGSIDPKDPKFSGFYVKDNKVVAVVGIGTDPTVSLSAELLYGKIRSLPKLISRGAIPARGCLEVRDGHPTYGFVRCGGCVIHGNKYPYTKSLLLEYS